MKSFLLKTGRLMAALLAFMLMCGVAFTADSMKKIRVGTEGAYPPYNFINDRGEIDGFERDLGDRICEIAKLDCVWVKNDWNTIIPNLLSGNYDAIIAAMSIVPERRKVIDFTMSYFPPNPSSYVAPEGSSERVKEGVVAVQKATVQAGYIAETRAEMVEFPKLDGAIAAMKSGEVDAVFSDRGTLEKIVAESNGKLRFVGSNVVLEKGMGIGIRKSDIELKGKLDAAIEQMRKDGSLSKLIAKWFDGKVVDY